MSWRRLLSVYPTVIADNDTVCSCDCFLAWQFPCAFSRYSTLEADRDLVSAQCGKDDVPYGEEYVDSTTPWQSMCERDAIVMTERACVDARRGVSSCHWCQLFCSCRHCIRHSSRPAIVQQSHWLLLFAGVPIGHGDFGDKPDDLSDHDGDSWLRYIVLCRVIVGNVRV